MRRSTVHGPRSTVAVFSGLLGAALLLAACHKPAPASAQPAAPPVVNVLATGDVWGQVEPCG